MSALRQIRPVPFISDRPGHLQQPGQTIVSLHLPLHMTPEEYQQWLKINAKNPTENNQSRTEERHPKFREQERTSRRDARQNLQN